MSKFKNINLIRKSINNENVFLIIESDGSINSYFSFFMNKYSFREPEEITLCRKERSATSN